MDKIIVEGGKPLYGEVRISGAKNAVLPIMAACIITPGKYILKNVPNLRDTRTMSILLQDIGANVEFKENILKIDTNNCNNPTARYDLVKTMRASFYVLGPLLARFGEANVSLPGGCAWGPRPVNFHIKALEKMGIQTKLKGGYLNTHGSLIGKEIKFEKTSVGATGNILMAAVTAKGETVIRNAAMEPEITALADFLIKTGANISGIGTETLTVQGMEELNGNFDFEIIPDRIEAGTFLIGSMLCGGEITLINSNPNHLSALLSKLESAGAEIKMEDQKIKLTSKGVLNPVNMTTAPYPGFPTDLQAQWMVLMTKSSGSAVIKDEVYTDRFTHIAELNRLGSKISLNSNIAIVEGVEKLKGAPLMSTDIRASASLILGALAAEGESEISRVYHIDRGYEKIVRKFSTLGAKIERISDKG